MHFLSFLMFFHAVNGIDESSNRPSAVLSAYHNLTTSPRNATSSVKSLTTDRTRPNSITISVASGTALAKFETGSRTETRSQLGNGTLHTSPSQRSNTSDVRTHAINNITHAVNINSTTAIAPTGSGFEYALSCDELSKSWDAAFFDWDHSVMHDSQYMVLKTRTYTETYTMYAEQSVPISTTVCLATSRELGGQVIHLSSTSLWPSSYSITVSDYTRPSYPTPTPGCSFDLTDCNNLWNSYDAYTNYVANAPPDDVRTLRELSQPLCEQIRPYAYCNQCTVTAHNADVHYWPLVAIGEPCDPDRRFTTATPTIPGQPNTAVVGNVTFTSPTLYLRLDYLHATAPEGRFCGTAMQDVVMGFEPSEISTIRFSYVPTETWTHEHTLNLGSTTECDTLTGIYVSTIYNTMPFDFKDLMGAVPGAAYDGQIWQGYYSVVEGRSEPVTDRNYLPYIWVPSRLREVDPHCSTCELEIHINDPPVALQMASTLKTPETPTFTTATTLSRQSSSPIARPGSPLKTQQISPTTTAGSQPLESGVAERPGTKSNTQSSKPTSKTEPSKDAPPSADQLPDVQSPGNPPPDEDPNDPTNEAPGLISRIVSIIAGLGFESPAVITKASQARPAFEVVKLGGAPVSISGDIVIVGGKTLSIEGGPVIIDGQSVKLISCGLELVSTTTLRFPLANPEAQPSDRVTIPVEGDSITAAISGSYILLSQVTATAILLPRQKITFGDHRLSALPSMAGLQIDGNSIWLFDAGLPRGSLNIDGEEVSAICLDETRILLVSGSRTAVIANGGKVTFGSATAMALVDGSGVFFESSSVVPFFRQEGGGKLEEYGILAQMGGRYVVITNDGTTFTSPNGEATITDGHTVSAARDGRHIVVDGSETESPISSTPTSTAVNKSVDAGEEGKQPNEDMIHTAGALRMECMISAWLVIGSLGSPLLALM